MDLGSKSFAVGGAGSPFTSRLTLLAAMLLELGYRFAINEKGEKKVFQDVTDLQTQKRQFVYLFDGCHQIDFGTGDPLYVKQAADIIQGVESTNVPRLADRAEVYAASRPHGSTPVRSLQAMEPAEALVRTYADLLKSLRELRVYVTGFDRPFSARQIKIKRNGRDYYLPIDATEAERKQMIQQIT